MTDIACFWHFTSTLY